MTHGKTGLVRWLLPHSLQEEEKHPSCAPVTPSSCRIWAQLVGMLLPLRMLWTEHRRDHWHSWGPQDTLGLTWKHRQAAEHTSADIPPPKSLQLLQMQSFTVNPWQNAILDLKLTLLWLPYFPLLLTSIPTGFQCLLWQLSCVNNGFLFGHWTKRKKKKKKGEEKVKGKGSKH